jgi:cytidine deaminase
LSLLDTARDIRGKAYAPYSNFKVGVALRSASGEVFVGVNVENAAYPEGTCAEAGAIAAMIAAGQSEIVEVAVIADAPTPVQPCGGCRQKLKEFSKPDVVVTMANLSGVQMTMTVGELLPGAFTKDQLDM